MQAIVRALYVDDDPALRAVMTKFDRLGTNDAVELEWDAAPDAPAALALLQREPHVVIVDMALTGDASNRDGLFVVYAARQQGAHVFVLTGQTLEDTIQDELLKLEIPVLMKPYRPALLMSAIASAALAPRQPRMKPSLYSLSPIATLMRQVDGNVSLVSRQVVAVCVAQALADTSNNKCEAARLLQVDRGFLDRALLYLPRKVV